MLIHFYNFKINKMLRSLFLFVILILCNISITKAQTLSIGPVLGANFSKISKLDNAKTRTGLSAGVFANYSIDEHFGLNVKLIYSQLGTKLDNTTESTRLNYIQLPISGVYFFGESGNRVRPKIFLGPYVGFLLSATDTNGNDIVDANGNDYYKKVDFGGQVGVGLNYRIKDRTWLNVDASYASSLGKIIENSNITYKNTALALNLGVSFPVSGSN